MFNTNKTGAIIFLYIKMFFFIWLDIIQKIISKYFFNNNDEFLEEKFFESEDKN